MLLLSLLLILVFTISSLWNFSVSREKSDKEIMREIQAIMRQVASSITYLPCLDETCKNQIIGTLSDHFNTSLGLLGF